MKRLITCLTLSVAGCLLVGMHLFPDSAVAAGEVTQGTYTPQMSDYCVQPPFLAGYVPPQVLFTLSKDHKMYTAAYNDASDIDNDGELEITYKHSFDYYGYFDAHKCYSYSSGVFIPDSITTDKYCSGGKFSGNFLNWATMSRADIIKLVIYGGYRTSDTSTDKFARISGEYIPQDGHIWGKEYVGADAAKLFAGGVANKRALFCVNGTTVSGNAISQLKILPDVTAVSNATVSGGLRAWHWINVDGNTDICADGRMDVDGDGGADDTKNASGQKKTYNTNYNITVEACNPDRGFVNVGDWEIKHCKQYGTNYRPVGLMQLYGETAAGGAKVCSRDMATACTANNQCTGNGQCVDAANMFFGLIAGSFKNPKAGGYVRKDVFSINEETNQNNGTFSSSVTSGKGMLIKSIEQLKCTTSYPLSTHIGNPIGEILYEGLRYWSGKGTPTSAFVNGISDGASGDDGNYASKPAWDTPAALYPSCSIPFNLVFSDIYNSFDHDQVPGSAFATVSGDLPDFNAATLANTIWANESLGTSLVIGESGTTAGSDTDGTCGSKTVDGLGNVKGICPAEGNQSGSYYAAAAALYGNTMKKAKTGTPNVPTYVVAFNSNVPEIRVFTNSGNSVLVSPYGKSVSSSSGWSCSTTNTSFNIANKTTIAGTTTKNLSFVPKTTASNCPTLAQVSFYVLETEYNTDKQLKYIKFRVATDDLGGSDFDLDMLTEYVVCAQGAANSACSSFNLTGNQVAVSVSRAYSSAGNPAALGFTIAGAGSDSGTYLIVQHTSTPPSGSGWAGSPLPTTNASMKFVAPGAATLPKPPLWYAAKYGGFRDLDGDALPYTDATCSYPLTHSGRNPKCNEWSSKTPGEPDTYFEISNPSQMERRLRDALDAILARVSSGTAASILNNSEGSGASLLQAVFYPNKDFDNNTSGQWIGEMHNMWYYLDPFLQANSIREDTNQDNKLNLKQDRIAQFYFDADQNRTRVRLFADADGDGSPDQEAPNHTTDPDSVGSLWKAGRKLWARTLSSSPRVLYTHTGISTLDSATTGLTAFGTANTATLTGNADFRALLTPQGSTTDATRLGKLIDWTHGTDQTADADGTKYRSRKVTINTCDAAGSGCQTADGVYTREWKLADIVSSTPKLVSNVPLNNYNQDSPAGYADRSYAAFTKTDTYKHRGMVLVGANDGMLHAFKLGTLQENNGRFDKAQFNDPATGTAPATAASDLGREEWAFIPRQVLPYLPYLKDSNYCHLYTVDRTSTIVDTSTLKSAACSEADYWQCPKEADGSTWRTIVVGGMGMGGSAKWNGDTACTAPTDAVKTPVKGTSATSGALGYSSYFALDVTDPATPKYLWEFPGTTAAAGQMGFATTGPAIVRIATKTAGKPDHTKNARWFAVFVSGPTGPIDTVRREFLGTSDQQLRIFVVDLADGTLVRTITQYKDKNGTLVNLPARAFGGSQSTNWIDTDRSYPGKAGWYSDDVIYIGFTRQHTDGTWSRGGVIRLTTMEDTDPNNWFASMLIDDVGPITTSITKLQDRKNENLWIHFGTGRYFRRGDDMSNQQAIYGIKEPCYATKTRGNRFPDYTSKGSDGSDNTIDKNCWDPSPGGLVDQSGDEATAPLTVLDVKAAGWMINLEPASGASGAEREITDPVASTSGAVLFTVLRPSTDVCRFGGETLIWAVRYDTGGVPPARAMQGKALMQVSTGAFAEVSLASAFRNPGNKRLDGRRLATPIQGVPPTSQGLALIANPPPVRKILQIQEK